MFRFRVPDANIGTGAGFGTGPFCFFCSCSRPLVAIQSPQRVTEAQQNKAVWNTIRSWSGSGDAQLDSFTSDTGALRIEWEAKAENEATAPGIFRVAIHSSISGRPLTVPIDHRGPGRGTAFVSEEPRVFFALVRRRISTGRSRFRNGSGNDALEDWQTCD